jgi:hypothetical protein
MKATYRISEEDYVRAMKLFSKITPKIAAILILMVLVLVVVIVLGSGAVKGGAIGGLIGGVVVAVVIRYVVNPIIARRHYRNYKAIQEPITIDLKEEGVELSTSDGGGLVRWEKMLKWRQSEEYLLIYPMPRMYHIIPKSIADSGFELQRLIKLLQERIGNEI